MKNPILFTCGLGDFLAIESWLTSEDKHEVETILWASRARQIIQDSIDLRLIFPNLKEEITLWDTWCDQETWQKTRAGNLAKDVFCITGKHQLPEIGVNLNSYGISMDDIIDYGVCATLEKVQKENTPFQGSMYSKATLADIHKFDLPEECVCIHPHSINALTDFRDLNEKEWKTILYYLERGEIKGVVLGTGQGKVAVPKHESLINLIDKTTIAEALEITKQSFSFMGASSVFSVLASKHISNYNIYVKGHETLLNNEYKQLNNPETSWWIHPLWKFYYSPLENNYFLRTSLEVL